MARSTSRRRRRSAQRRSHFQTLLYSVIGLTILALIGTVLVSLVGNNDSEMHKAVVEKLSNSWQLGFALILGLIGGKTA